MDFRKHIEDRYSGMFKVEFICVIWKVLESHFFFDCVDDGFVVGFRGLLVKVIVEYSLQLGVAFLDITIFSPDNNATTFASRLYNYIVS